MAYSVVKTPALSSLAEEGVVLSTRLTVTVHSCALSRYVLSTGQLPSKNWCDMTKAPNLLPIFPNLCHYSSRASTMTKKRPCWLKCTFGGPDQLHGFEIRDLQRGLLPRGHGWFLIGHDLWKRGLHLDYPVIYCHPLLKARSVVSRSNQCEIWRRKCDFHAQRYLYDYCKTRSRFDPFCCES